MNRHLHCPKLPAIIAAAFAMVSLMANARGNPVGGPLDELAGVAKLITFAVAALAIGLEVALMGYVTCWAYDILDRRGFMIRLAVINVCTYSVFVLGLHRFVKRVWVTEGLIWVTESLALFLLITAMSGKEPRMKHVLALAFVGNLLSFAVGWMG